MHLYVFLSALLLSAPALNGIEKSPIVAEMEAVAFGTYQLIHPEDTEKTDAQKNLALEAAQYQSTLKTHDYLIEIGVPSEYAYCYAAALQRMANRHTTSNAYFAPPDKASHAYSILNELYKRAGIDRKPILFFDYRWPNTKDVSEGTAYGDCIIILDYWTFAKLPIEEQIAVIAHEVGHIARNHSKKSAEIQAPCAQTVDEDLQRFYASSKMNEFEADLLAAEMLGTETGLIKNFEKISRYAPKGASPSPEWYTEYERYLSHPAPERRIAALKEWAKAQNKNTELNG